MPRVSIVLAILILICFSALATEAQAGQLGPNGDVISRCNMGVTSAWDRQVSLVSDLMAPGVVTIASFLLAIGGLIVFTRAGRSQAKKPTWRRWLGAATGFLFAVSATSLLLCCATLVAHYQ